MKVRTSEDAYNITVSVHDNGIELSKEDQEQLFRIDHNLSKPGTGQEPGTGLGLILCREFVEEHHGKIWVESEINKGSCFNFTLPKERKKH